MDNFASNAQNWAKIQSVLQVAGSNLLLDLFDNKFHEEVWSAMWGAPTAIPFEIPAASGIYRGLRFPAPSSGANAWTIRRPLRMPNMQFTLTNSLYPSAYSFPIGAAVLCASSGAVVYRIYKDTGVVYLQVLDKDPVDITSAIEVASETLFIDIRLLDKDVVQLKVNGTIATTQTLPWTDDARKDAYNVTVLTGLDASPEDIELQDFFKVWSSEEIILESLAGLQFKTQQWGFNGFFDELSLDDRFINEFYQVMNNNLIGGSAITDPPSIWPYIDKVSLPTLVVRAGTVGIKLETRQSFKHASMYSWLVGGLIAPFAPGYSFNFPFTGQIGLNPINIPFVVNLITGGTNVNVTSKVYTGLLDLALSGGETTIYVTLTNYPLEVDPNHPGILILDSGTGYESSSELIEYIYYNPVSHEMILKPGTSIQTSHSAGNPVQRQALIMSAYWDYLPAAGAVRKKYDVTEVIQSWQVRIRGGISGLVTITETPEGWDTGIYAGAAGLPGIFGPSGVFLTKPPGFEQKNTSESTMFYALPPGDTEAYVSYPVGVGNGSNVYFSIPSPVVDDSESIYVNGTLQVRDTDYTINNTTGLIQFVPGSTPPANSIIMAHGSWYPNFRVLIGHGVWQGYDDALSAFPKQVHGAAIASGKPDAFVEDFDTQLIFDRESYTFSTYNYAYSGNIKNPPYITGIPIAGVFNNIQKGLLMNPGNSDGMVMVSSASYLGGGVFFELTTPSNPGSLWFDPITIGMMSGPARGVTTRLGPHIYLDTEGTSEYKFRPPTDSTATEVNISASFPLTHADFYIWETPTEYKLKIVDLDSPYTETNYSITKVLSDNIMNLWSFGVILPFTNDPRGLFFIRRLSVFAGEWSKSVVSGSVDVDSLPSISGSVSVDNFDEYSLVASTSITPGSGTYGTGVAIDISGHNRSTFIIKEAGSEAADIRILGSVDDGTTFDTPIPNVADFSIVIGGSATVVVDDRFTDIEIKAKSSTGAASLTVKGVLSKL